MKNFFSFLPCWFFVSFVLCPELSSATDSCLVEGVVRATGQPLGQVSVTILDEKNQERRVATTQENGQFSFSLGEPLLRRPALTLFFEREGLERLQHVRLLAQTHRRGTLCIDPLQAEMFPRPSAETSSPVLLQTAVGAVPSVHGRTIFVAPYDLDQGSWSASAEQFNAIRDVVL